MDVHAALLGPLEVQVDGEPVDLGPLRQRLVLGMLLLCPDGVGVDRLVDLLWPDPPRNAVNKLQGYITALRHILEPDRAPRTPSLVERTGTQYRLRLPPGGTDLEEFRDHLARAGDLVGTAAQREHLAALELWRGPVLDGLADSTQIPEIVGLQAMIRDAVIGAAELARAAASPDAGIVHWLLKAVAEWRYDESLYAALIYTYARLGQLDRAHDAYRLIRGRLVDELGVEPGAQLQAAFSLVLRGDDERVVTLGNRLPRSPADFVGRLALRTEISGGLSSDTPVVLISGPPGVGKTALAVRAGTDNAEQFPDGQIFVSLRAGSRSRPTDDVLYDVLVNLGVQARSVPESPIQRRALFASIGAARRVLFVLDDAGSAADVRDLLPPGGSAGVIVTCRSHLPALDCGARIELSPLSTEDSVTLLDGMVDGRLSAEMLRQFARQCGNLPLALRIVAGRVGQMPDEAITEFAARLSDERQRLNELSLDDLEVRAGLQASWSGLTADAARGLALLSVLDAPTVDPMVLAAITGGAAGWPELEQLTDQHLVDSAGCSLRMHDLVRTFARESADDTDTGTAIDAAARWYIASFLNAQTRVFPGQASDLDILGALAAPPREFDDNARADRWLAEHAIGTWRLVLQASSVDRVDATLLSRFTGVWGRYADHVGLLDAWEKMLRVAMDSALLAGDSAAQQLLLVSLSVLDIRRGDFEKALALLRQAAESGVAGRNEAVVFNNLAGVLNELGRPTEAIGPAREAVRTFGDIGDQRGVAMALNNLSRSYDKAGDASAARATVDELFALGTQLSMDDVLGFAHNARGDVATSAGDDVSAARHYRLADECGRAAGDRRIQGYALHQLALLRGACSDPMALLRRADALYREIGDVAGADEVRRDMLVAR